MSIRKVRLNQTISFPGSRDPSLPSAVIMDVTPMPERNGIRLDITLVVMPIIFMNKKRKPTGYWVGCRDANFSLNVSPGKLSAAALPAPHFSFEREFETGSEKSNEFRPKLEAKVGTDGVGGGVEAGARVSKELTKDRLKVTGDDDSPVLSAVRRSTVGWVQWSIASSPLAHKNIVLRCSKKVSVMCHWPDTPRGAVRMYAPRYAFCTGLVELSPPRQLLAAFWHWVKCRSFRNDISAEHFEIAERQ